jgi:hypothetical protein
MKEADGSDPAGGRIPPGTHGREVEEERAANGLGGGVADLFPAALDVKTTESPDVDSAHATVSEIFEDGQQAT